MASEQCVLDYMSRALWDPHPTQTDVRAQQLAAALGYPLSWRVVRTIEDTPLDSTISNKEEEGTPSSTTKCIVDRIYAGKPGTGCDMWFHHQAAMQAAASWNAEESTPFDSNGGHLLARQPLFSKGDKVQVLYGDSWWDASIVRRKEDKTGFKYGVHYVEDGTKQSGVDESLIRWRPEAPDPKLVAAKLGMEGWEAYLTGHNRYKVVAPNGEVYLSKKQALAAYATYNSKDANKDIGDPPWRLDGNEFVGRHIVYTVEHKASARRTVKIEQYGTVKGWISETDVDRAGEPGFVSERTGKPARLFHIKFEEVPHHPYVSLLLESIDLEEYEVEQCLLPEDEQPAVKESPKKKGRKSKGQT